MKKWKLVLLILTFFILIGAGSAYYFFEMKEYDVADEEIEEITETEYVLNLPEEEEEEGSESETGNESGDTESTSEDEDTKGQTGTDSNSNEEEKEEEKKQGNVPSNDVKKEEPKNSKTDNNNEQTKPAKKEVTVASIKDRYRPTFEDLEDQANQKINSIINRALEEFQQKRANDEKVSFSYFYSKYNDAGKSLEAKTDSAFEVAYAALEKDLKKHGFSTSHAKEFRTAYEEKKAERRNALFRKALEVL